MALIALKCPSCGADIELDESREFAFCSYCGSKVMQEKKIVELKGNVKVDGISTVDKLLERACILVEDEDYIQAEKSFDKVLEIEPKCADAYWGKVLCEFEISDIEIAKKSGIDITKSTNYKRALSFASEDKKEKYLNYGKSASVKCFINQIVEVLSKIIFAISPIVAFYVSAGQTGPDKFLAVILGLWSALWLVSYFIIKKFSGPQKKSNRNLWLIFGGILLIMSISIACSERVPADEVANQTTTVISEIYSE